MTIKFPFGLFEGRNCVNEITNPIILNLITLTNHSHTIFDFSLSFISMTSSQKKVMDVLFLIDATGSMSATIQAAHDKATEMAINLRVKNPDVDFMFGSVCYRDPIDSPTDVHQMQDLDGNIDSLVSFFSSVQATGGGDGPEDWVGAYKLALDSVTWRDGAKTIIHIADAPAHGNAYCGSVNHEEESPKLQPLIEAVAKRGILISGMDLNYGASASFNVCKDIYDRAGGCRFNIERLSLNGMQFDVPSSAGPAPPVIGSSAASPTCLFACTPSPPPPPPSPSPSLPVATCACARPPACFPAYGLPPMMAAAPCAASSKCFFDCAHSTFTSSDACPRPSSATATIGGVLSGLTEAACDAALSAFYS
jgi:hypothetical protein